MSEAPKKSPWRKVIIFLVFLLFLLIIFGAIYLATTNRIDAAVNRANETNSSIVEVNTQVTNIDNRGNPSTAQVIGDSLTRIILGLIIAGLIAYLGAKWISWKKDQKYSKERCMQAAREDLMASNYPVFSGQKAKFDHEYHGGDSEKHPRWAFGFVADGMDDTTGSQSRFALITCIVHAKTLEVTNQRQGRGWDDTLEQLNKQRLGKWATMNDPEKPTNTGLEEFFQGSQKRVQIETPMGEPDA